MIKKIDKTDEFRERLKKEGKVRFLLDSPEDLERQIKFDEDLKKFRRSYLIKDAGSIKSSGDFYIWHSRNYSFY